MRSARPLLAVLLLFAARAASAGGLFVASQNTESVLEYSSATGAFERVLADTVTQGFQNPGGIALRPSDGVLYVTSQALPHEIWRYTTATGARITPALVTGLFGPRGIGFDASGANLFFADPQTNLVGIANQIKKIALPGGAPSVVGTTAGANFCGVAVNGTQVFAADSDGNRIVRFQTDGSSGTTTVISSGLNEPTGILFRSATQMLIADTGSDRVLEYTLSGGTWSFTRVVLPATSGVQDPYGLALAPDGRLTVTGGASNDVVLVHLTTLAVTPLVAPGAGGLGAPKDAVWSGSTLLVASANTNDVIYYNSSGSPTGVRARGISTALDAGIALSPNGTRLLIASSLENEVVEHDAVTGGLLRTFGFVCNFPPPADVAYGPDGLAYVACQGDDSVARIDPATGNSLGPFVLAQSGGLFFPRSLVFGPDQDLYVTSATGKVLRYDGATGSFLDVFRSEE